MQFNTRENIVSLVNVSQIIQYTGNGEGTSMTEHIKAEGPNSAEIEY